MVLVLKQMTITNDGNGYLLINIKYYLLINIK